ncbi:MAG: zinc-finger domain-containing protein [Alphaproteobacteria bacterium]|nr:zinc-finger domain-containing protein [Alphaproteobacteria bacterium]
MVSQAMKEPEVIKVDSDADQVMCDGGGGPLGHPQVWYSFDGKCEVSCHYCGRKFIKSA